VETSDIDALIDDARTHITPKDGQIAVLLLNRIQRSKGSELTDWHRFRIFTNLGAANVMRGKGEAASRYLSLGQVCRSTWFRNGASSDNPINASLLQSGSWRNFF
jgi:hypothetical protein